MNMCFSFCQACSSSIQSLKDGEEALTLDNNSVLVALGKSVNITVALSDSSSAVVSSVKVGDTPLSAGAAGYNTTVGEDVTITVTVDVPKPTSNQTITFNEATCGTGGFGWKKSAGSTVYKCQTFETDYMTTAVGGSASNRGTWWGSDWRFYQSGGSTLTLTAKQGYSIVKVKFIYDVSNTGILMCGSEQVKKGDEYKIDNNTVTFSVGNTGTKTNGQVKITAMQIWYTAD